MLSVCLKELVFLFIMLMKVAILYSLKTVTFTRDTGDLKNHGVYYHNGGYLAPAFFAQRISMKFKPLTGQLQKRNCGYSCFFCRVKFV